jgi:hypothetical protein
MGSLILGFSSDDILRPSVERPDQVFVKESSDAQYVPAVFYVEKDKYGNDIKKPAHPYFPLEYLFVTLEAGAKASLSFCGAVFSFEAPT